MKIQGLNRKFRMLKHSDFGVLRQSPQILRLGGLVFFYKPNEYSYHRLGITIKGRCTSVERSRLKRSIREWFRCLEYSQSTYDINLFIDLARNQRLLNSGVGSFLKQASGTFLK
jgi:ribonuclease P protein component